MDEKCPPHQSQYHVRVNLQMCAQGGAGTSRMPAGVQPPDTEAIHPHTGKGVYVAFYFQKDKRDVTGNPWGGRLGVGSSRRDSPVSLCIFEAVLPCL